MFFLQEEVESRRGMIFYFGMRTGISRQALCSLHSIVCGALGTMSWGLVCM